MSLVRQNTATLNRRSIARDLQKAAIRFAEYDIDGSKALDFEEFYAMQPQIVRKNHSATAIRTWFDAADSDGSGALSVDEFFCWSLSNAAVKYGSAALEATFKKYDADKTGCLDAREFSKVCQDAGFGAVAHDIFTSLDNDGSGAINYPELQTRLCELQPNANQIHDHAKRMLTSLVWSWDSGESANKLDTSGWRIKADTAEAVRSDPQQLLRESGAHIADVIALFDLDADNAMLIDDVE